jgi:hypothetical protein
VRKLLVGLLLVVPYVTSCTSRATVVPATTRTGASTGASGPRPALDAFMAAIRARDLQALGAVWGDKNGAIRDTKRISREEVEKRELVLMCYFQHDSFKVLGEQPAAGGERVMEVTLTSGTLSRTTNFYLVQGADRWYVRNADMEPVRDLCGRRKP